MKKTTRVISVILKCIVIVSAVLGTYLSAYAGRNSFMGGKTVFMYFTIQSNLAVALISLIGLILLGKNKSVSYVWYVIKLMGAVSITLTGVVFCFVLVPTLGDNAWNVQNVLTHVVVPIVFVIDFFVTGVQGDYKWCSVLWVLIPPILYAIYAGIGYVLEWQFAEGIHYPYFFLNWGSPAGAFGFSDELPFMGCMWWILTLLVFLLIVGCLYLAVLKKLARRKNVKE